MISLIYKKLLKMILREYGNKKATKIMVA